jgi:hypothetical protein
MATAKSSFEFSAIPITDIFLGYPLAACTMGLQVGIGLPSNYRSNGGTHSDVVVSDFAQTAYQDTQFHPTFVVTSHF